MYVILSTDRTNKNDTRYFYTTSLYANDKNKPTKSYTSTNQFTLHNLKYMVNTPNAKGVHTLEEAEAILKRYHRYKKTGKFWDVGIMHIIKLSKLIKRNKHLLNK